MIIILIYHPVTSRIFVEMVWSPFERFPQSRTSNFLRKVPGRWSLLDDTFQKSMSIWRYLQKNLENILDYGIFVTETSYRCSQGRWGFRFFHTFRNAVSIRRNILDMWCIATRYCCSWHVKALSSCISSQSNSPCSCGRTNWLSGPVTCRTSVSCVNPGNGITSDRSAVINTQERTLPGEEHGVTILLAAGCATRKGCQASAWCKQCRNVLGFNRDKREGDRVLWSDWFFGR